MLWDVSLQLYLLLSWSESCPWGHHPTRASAPDPSKDSLILSASWNFYRGTVISTDDNSKVKHLEAQRVQIKLPEFGPFLWNHFMKCNIENPMTELIISYPIKMWWQRQCWTAKSNCACALSYDILCMYEVGNSLVRIKKLYEWQCFN